MFMWVCAFMHAIVYVRVRAREGGGAGVGCPTLIF